MAEHEFENVTIEEKPTLRERATAFVAEHPSITVIGYGIAYLGLVIPACAAFGCLIGKTAGKTAAKELLEAGVRLGYE